MKLINAKKHIQQIAKEALNDEQKKIANIILEKVAINDEVDDKFISFIEPNIKCGFVFDKAPEVEQDNIALLLENKNLKITSKNSQLNHYLLIGENYEVLKNLQLVYTRIENGEKVGCVDVIYIDPPYNTEKSCSDGNSYKDKVESTKFIYRDKFRRTG